MHTLFAISVLAFCTLLWASLSIARHIRAGSRPSGTSADARTNQPRTGAMRETAGESRARQARSASRKAA